MEERNEIITVEGIRNRVYMIRGMQVMLDSDLAEIYGYEAKYLNRQVKNNINRFPEDFMFQLTDEERENLRCNFCTANISSKSRTNPYAFTEQGIYMLATVLKGELATQQSIFIMRAFKEMRHYIKQNEQFVTQNEMNMVLSRVSENTVRIAGMIDHQKKMDKSITDIEKSIELINENFISDKDYKNFVIYKGQKFEADKTYIDIYQQAIRSIYVIDDYVNVKTLELLSQKNNGVEVILFTENGHGKRGFLTDSVVNDFKEQYPPLRIKSNPDWHDRLIVLDYNLPTEKVYHCGASSKDAGKKLCAINEIEVTRLFHPAIDKLLMEPDRDL